jgi:uncharacterized protein YbjT (DUF2867 family)
MTSNGRILVVGGTRGTGLLIARLVATRGAAVRVVARDVTRARTVLGTDVQVVPGDITRRETLPHALEDVQTVIFTAGCRSGHPASRSTIKATEYEGVLNTLAAARDIGFAGRFLYMTSSGVFTRSLFATCLNLYKGDTLVWRRRAEEAIRESSVDYTIVRAGVLLNRPGGLRPILLTQQALPLSLRHRIARADVAEVFVAAVGEPRASRATFEVVWSGQRCAVPWTEALRTLRSDKDV